MHLGDVQFLWDPVESLAQRLFPVAQGANL